MTQAYQMPWYQQVLKRGKLKCAHRQENRTMKQDRHIYTLTLPCHWSAFHTGQIFLLTRVAWDTQEGKTQIELTELAYPTERMTEQSRKNESRRVIDLEKQSKLSLEAQRKLDALPKYGG